MTAANRYGEDPIWTDAREVRARGARRRRSPGSRDRVGGASVHGAGPAVRRRQRLPGTGNAATRGYDQARDLGRLSQLVCGVHVKDRLPGGVSVPLGDGAADVPSALAALVGAACAGAVVLEMAIGDHYLGFAERHLTYVRTALAAVRDGSVEGSPSRS